MTGLFIDIGSSILSGMVQLLAGCLLSPAVAYAASRKVVARQEQLLPGLVFIIASSFLGTLLPVTIYGIIPLFAAAVLSGFRVYAVFPAVVSNALFNLLVPYTDSSFAWVSAPGRILTANVAGICAGLLLMKLLPDSRWLINRQIYENLDFNPFRLSCVIKFTSACINTLGIFLVTGAIANSIFHRYFYLKLMSGVYSNPLGSSVSNFLLGFNVMDPVFILALTIINSFINFSQLIGLFSLLKIRGVIAYHALYSVLALLLALSVMLR